MFILDLAPVKTDKHRNFQPLWYSISAVGGTKYQCHIKDDISLRCDIFNLTELYQRSGVTTND